MIAFRQVTSGPLRRISFQIGDGAACKVITGSENLRGLLLDLLIGARIPESGRVTLLGEDIGGLTEEENIRLMRRVGIVWNNGGAVSNLKVWENITLPARYHGGEDLAALEVEVVGLLGRLGMTGILLRPFLTGMPGPLSPWERRVAGMVRVLLCDPDLVIYDGIFTGLELGESRRLGDVADWFHHRREGRTSLYLSASGEPLAFVKAYSTLNVAAGEAALP